LTALFLGKLKVTIRDADWREKKVSEGNLLPTSIMDGVADKRRDAFYLLSGNKQ
jgi:hypothetical protein